MRSRVYSIIYMFIITLFFAFVVNAVKSMNEERIGNNQQLKLRKVILEVFGFKEIADDMVPSIYNTRIKSINIDGMPVYIGYEDGGQTVIGYAFPVEGPGFWGPVEGMAAVDGDAFRLIGIAFYRHSETPGLGARISEDWFKDQFKGIRIFPIKDDLKIFYLKPQGSGSAENELDAVTGATGTSRAVEAFLNDDLDRFLEMIWPKVKKDRINKRLE